MWKSTVIIVLAFASTAWAFGSLDFDPFVDIPFKPVKSSADRIREHGYPAESHFVTTSDGYILNVFRIPYSPKLGNQNVRKPVVLLQHGLFSCSDCFLLNGPDNALAFNFADAGFDVWLGNARGNIYSRNHSTMSLNHPYFYRFSWHEIAVVDMADSIDYILKETGETSLYYSGHSQGGTVYFVLTSELPEYNDKIKAAHLLAPAVFMGNTTHEVLLAFEPYVTVPGGTGMKILSDQVFIPSNMLVQRLLDTACGGESAFPEYCRLLFMTWAGTEATNMNTTLLPQIAETHPAGISTNQGIHYIQLHLSNGFHRLDHGLSGNLKYYGQATPPEYDLSRITAPTNVYYGLSDMSVNWRDMQRIPDYVKLKSFYEMPDPTWSHIDFIFSKYVKAEVNDRVVKSCVDQEKSYGWNP